MAATAQDIMGWIAELLGSPGNVMPSETGRLPSPTGSNPYSSGVLGLVPPAVSRADTLALNPQLDPMRDSATGGRLMPPRLVPPRLMPGPMSGRPDTTEMADEPDEFPADATDVPDSVRLRSPADRVPMGVPTFPTGTVRREPAPPAPAGDPDAIVHGAEAAAAARARAAAGRPRQPGFLDYANAFLGGLSGGGGILGARGLQGQTEARNATYDALIERNASPELARAITLNPAQFQSILPSLFSPRTVIVNNRLVEAATGRVIQDFSDQFRPLPENTVGVLNQATGRVAPTPGLPGRRRDLSAEDIRKLRNEGSVLGNVGRLGEGFRNTFSSPNLVVGGDINNWIARNTTHGSPAQREAARWWQDYQRNVEIVERHEMFGAALTPTEQAAWRAADINPNMEPGMVRANLATRHRIMTGAMQRYAQALAASGYDATAISSAFGLTPDALGIRPGGRRDEAITTPPGDSGFRVRGVR